MDAYEGEIIDCHWHPAVDSSLDLNWFAPSGSAQAQIDALRRLGFAHACGAPIRACAPASFDEIRRLNDAALALRDAHPNFYIPGIHIHPHFPEESCAEIERCCGGEGVRWIGEMVGYLMGFAEEYASAPCLAAFRVAAKHGAAINFHCSDLAVVDRVCREVPEAAFVLAHPGGGRSEFLPRLAKVAEHPNLHMDISGSGIDRNGILRKAIDEAGLGKLLFGTDYPINNPAVYLHGALFEPLSTEERDALFHGNFRRLCGLGRGE